MTNLSYDEGHYDKKELSFSYQDTVIKPNWLV